MQRVIWGTTFVALTVLGSGAWVFEVVRDRAETLDLARERIESTARLLEQHADRAFSAGGRIIQAAIEVADAQDVLDPANRERVFTAVRLLVEGSPQISSLWIMDANGVSLVESWGHPPPTVGSYAHRDYFQAHRAGEDVLYIGPQSIGSTTGLPRFTMSRPLRSPDGAFRGIAVAGVFSDYFVSVYQDAGLGADSTFRLSTSSGTTLAQWPLDSGQDAGAPSIAVTRTLARYPATITVSQPLAAVLKEWWMRSVISGLAVLAVIAAFGGLTTMGLRTAGHERKSRHALAKANADLERQVAERTDKREKPPTTSPQ